MQTMSSGYNTIADSDNAHYYAVVKNSDTTLNIELDNFKYSGMMNDSDDIKIGNACASQISFSIYNPIVILTGLELEIRQGLMVNGSLESVRIGFFTIQKPTSDGEVSNYVGYDRMVSKTTLGYFSGLTFPTTTIAIMNEIATKTGLTFATTLSTGYTIQEKPNGYTYREMIGYISALYGKNAIINRNGQLEFKWYTVVNPTTYTLDDNKIYDTGTEFNSEVNFTLGYIKCSVAKANSDTVTLTSGTGTQGIAIENPFMTQAILNAIFTSIGGLTFRAMSVKFLGDFRLDLGDIITVEHGSNTFNVPVMQIVHECDGGAVSQITSIAKTESEKSVDVSSITSKTLDRYYAELVSVNQAIVNKLDVNTANITYATIQSLDAVKATVNTINANYVSTNYLNANYIDADTIETQFAKIDMANVSVASMGTLLSNIGLITSATIVDGHITGYLDAVEVNASKITVGTLSVDRLVFRGIENSIVYSINDIKSKNLLKNTAVTKTVHGITFVVNTDKSITLNGTSDANIYIPVTSKKKIKTGNYILSGCPIGGNSNTYNLHMERNTTFEGSSSSFSDLDYGNGAVLQTTDDYYYIVYIYIKRGQILSNIIFKPMLRLATETDATYEPYRERLQALNYETINGENLTDRTITCDKIVANSITANEIASATITANEIASNTITASKINMTNLVGNSAFINAISTNSVVVGANATANTALANANSAKALTDAWKYSNTTYINGGNIYTGTITTDKLSANCVTTAKIASGAITADKIDVTDLFAQDITASGTITGGKFAGTGSAWIYPAKEDLDILSNYVWNHGTLTDAQKSAFDFQVNGTLDAYDVGICAKLALGNGDISLYPDYTPINSTINVVIDTTNAEKTIRIYGTNSFGRSLDTYLGINGLTTTNVNASRVTASTIIGTEATFETIDCPSTLSSIIKTSDTFLASQSFAVGTTSIDITSKMSAMDGYKRICNYIYTSQSYVFCEIGFASDGKIYLSVRNTYTSALTVKVRVVQIYLKQFS